MAGSNRRGIRNGRELFYRTDNRMMDVPVTKMPTFNAEVPRRLFEGRFEQLGWGERNYDVNPDEQRFLMISSEAGTSAELGAYRGLELVRRPEASIAYPVVFRL